MEEAEKLRQLILSSKMKQERILKFDAALDSIIYNIAVAYEDQITNSYQTVGNI